MVEPQKVLSPKAHVSDLHVIFSNPEWALAQFNWDGKPALGVRWNGSPEEAGDVGQPQSRGVPTWFVLPEELQQIVQTVFLTARKIAESALAQGYAAMAADRQREIEAGEWSEALVGDASR